MEEGRFRRLTGAKGQEKKKKLALRDGCQNPISDYLGITEGDKLMILKGE